MDKIKLQIAFDAMLNGKSFRLSKSVREDFACNDRRITDTWFCIMAITCNGNINICGNNHTILENYPLESIII